MNKEFKESCTRRLSIFAYGSEDQRKISGSFLPELLFAKLFAIVG